MQAYIDKNYPENIFIVTVTPKGLEKPPADMVKAYGLNTRQFIEYYQQIEKEIPGIVKEAISQNLQKIYENIHPIEEKPEKPAPKKKDRPIDI